MSKHIARTFVVPGTCPECAGSISKPTSVETTDYCYEYRHHTCSECGAEWNEKWQTALVTVTKFSKSNQKQPEG